MTTVDTEPYMLTTIDNPWNPYTNWDEWYEYDRIKGYDTPGFLARVCNTSIELSESDQQQAIRDAIDEIVSYNVLGIYRTVREHDEIKVRGTGGGSSQN